ncbi:hypothetical protein L9F63_005957 [Diploptera punctata]|uniref:Protein takeout n=1 Tax=Diploptera punctata TaxID=6984 RepID=A0AAD7ZBV8_DIPPU|nr:hypothetical protein L9F63_005957 [Diploptera punctata]
MFSSSLIVAFLCIGATYAALPLPSYVKPCARSDPGFEACALDRARETIKHIVNGDRKYKIPVIDPLEITEIIVDNKGPEQAGIDIKIRNAKFYGLKDTIIESIKLNYDEKSMHMDVRLPRIELNGEYEVKGRVLLLPITGKGPLNFTLENAPAQFDTDWIVENIDGSEFMSLTNSRLHHVEPTRVHYDLKNLFNGDKLLGPEMNAVLNENWRESFKELAPPVIQALSTVIAGTVNSIAHAVEYKNVFPLNV